MDEDILQMFEIKLNMQMFCKRLPVHAAYRPCALKADHSLQFLQNMFLFKTPKLIYFQRWEIYLSCPKWWILPSFGFSSQLSPVWDCLTFFLCIFNCQRTNGGSSPSYIAVPCLSVIWVLRQMIITETQI